MVCDIDAEGGERLRELGRELGEHLSEAERAPRVLRAVGLLGAAADALARGVVGARAQERLAVLDEVSAHKRLELCGRVAHEGDHRLDVDQERLLVVELGVFAALLATHLRLVSRLVVVRLLDENEALHGHEHLQHARRLGVPNLRAFALPCVEEREAHFSVLVEVGVDAQARGEVVRGRRLLGVGCGELEVEDEQAILVRGAGRARNCGADEVDPVFEDAHPNRVRDVLAQYRPLFVHLSRPCTRVAVLNVRA
mmetsp:Transcript_10182/g.33351  ORF Transcript_10182/g.33351 Transcript_10182/m.33351 type:complete len:254 (+) Transcript_10182:531-1292(+)